MQLLILIFSLLLAQTSLTLKSPAFANNHFIQSKYTCLGENINPPLVIDGIPEGTKSFALIMTDPDKSIGTFDHWVAWNIPATGKIEENSSPGVTGLNGRGENKYTGPCPPNGIHDYHFKIYALNAMLNLPPASGKEELLKAMEGRLLATAELVGQFTKAMNHLDK